MKKHLLVSLFCMFSTASALGNKEMRQNTLAEREAPLALSEGILVEIKRDALRASIKQSDIDSVKEMVMVQEVSPFDEDDKKEFLKTAHEVLNERRDSIAFWESFSNGGRIVGLIVSTGMTVKTAIQHKDTYKDFCMVFGFATLLSAAGGILFNKMTGLYSSILRNSLNNAEKINQMIIAAFSSEEMVD